MFFILENMCYHPMEIITSVQYNTLGESAHYDSLNFWSVGDTKLDWHGAESNQSSFIGIPALGTPTVATSNNPNDPGFQELNK